MFSILSVLNLKLSFLAVVVRGLLLPTERKPGNWMAVLKELFSSLVLLPSKSNGDFGAVVVTAFSFFGSKNVVFPFQLSKSMFFLLFSKLGTLVVGLLCCPLDFSLLLEMTVGDGAKFILS